MAKKGKDLKSTSTACHEDNVTNGLLIKENHNQFGIGENVGTHQNTPPSNHFQQVSQCPYTAQSNIQWQQPNPTFPHPQPQTHPCQPIWMTQPPIYLFSPIGTTDLTWQSPAINQLKTPSLSYRPSYPYPGPWDLSSWWGQPQQSMPSCSYMFPGACGYFPSMPPSMPDHTAALAPFLQRGNIQPPPKLSQKHQLLWEAQLAENVQLWNVVGQLQSELSDYKNRLTNLESHISILSSRPEEHSNKCALDFSTGQKSKRGRPKKPAAPNNVFHSSHNTKKSQRPGRKKAQCDVQTEPKEIEYHQERKMMDEKTTIQDISGAERSDVGLKNLPELKPERSEFKGSERKSASPTYVGMNSSGYFVWPTNIFTKDMGSESFYNDVSLREHGKKLVTGWSFANEEDVSIAVESEAIESGKNEDGMENDGSSGAEDTE